ncbi:coiled-coil domain-containing protein 169 isoform 2-T2 [Anableps anableps]
MAEGNVFSKYDFARLQAEIEEERELKEMLTESVCDLQCTVAELQERLRSVDGEDNEWKTRFETQVELNRHLERQISHIQQRLESIKGNPVDRLAFIRSYEDMAVAFHKANDERRAYLTEIATLSSVRELQKRQYTNQQQVVPDSKQIRGKYICRKAQAGSNKGTEEGLRQHVNEGGGGGGDSATERGMKKKSQRESRLPTLKHRPKHNP